MDNSQGLTTEDLDFMWDFFIVFDHPIISKLEWLLGKIYVQT